jgi:molybdopterin-guanine dinucleotide biosynthesis protein A
MQSQQHRNSGDVTLAILAGGEGSRMGRAKAELKIDGMAILEWLLEKIQWRGPTMLVSSPGREKPPGWEKFDLEVSDPQAGVGPIRGLLTALENVKTAMIVVSTVDMPLVRGEHLLWYVEKLGAKPQAAGCIGRHREQIEPFPSAWRCESARAIVKQHMDLGRRSVYSLRDHPNVEVIETPGDWSIWLNLNGRDDLDAFAKLGLGSAGF